VTEPGASDFGFELVDRTAVGLPSVGLEDPHGWGSSGDVLGYLQKQVVGAVVRGNNFDYEVRAKGKGPAKGDSSQPFGTDECDVGPADWFRQPRGQSEAKRVA
jgi:hypothetical protein